MEQEVGKICKDEAREACRRMKNGKAAGPDDLPVEIPMYQGERAVEFFDKTAQHGLEQVRRC